MNNSSSRKLSTIRENILIFWPMFFFWCAADLVLFLNTSFLLAFGFITFAFIGRGGLTPTWIIQGTAGSLCQAVVSFSLGDLGVFIGVFIGVFFGVLFTCFTSVLTGIRGVYVLPQSLSMITLFNNVNFRDGSLTKSITYSMSEHDISISSIN